MSSLLDRRDSTPGLRDAVTSVITSDRWQAAGPWAALESAGFTLVSVPEALGGSGGTSAMAAEIVEVAAEHNAAANIGEACILAGWALRHAGLSAPSGELTVAIGGRLVQRNARGWHITASLTDVTGCAADGTLTLVTPLADGESVVSLIPLTELVCSSYSNIADEPRVSISLDGWIERAALTDISPREFQARGAIIRSIQCLGAGRRAFDLSCNYALVRNQFGRPIGRFYAIQDHLAAMAGELLLLRAAVDAAVQSLDSDDEEAVFFAAAATKIQANLTATSVARLSHQVLGAFGFTDESDLGASTRRLWAWREEFGNEFEWAQRMAKLASGELRSGLWGLIADT